MGVAQDMPLRALKMEDNFMLSHNLIVFLATCSAPRKERYFGTLGWYHPLWADTYYLVGAQGQTFLM